ncbi:copper resistance protein CopC [Curtobacterium sp. 'Ferrero']|uniref:copper resistance CopC family protein n=1 Tax=Curtobacterium sp. 'Ferrero' TaxID=2033654 RepID=UPI001142BD6B|nr:copper resistance CopC family protein [Curtobacterium sp. 'Ferrero']
MRSRTVAPTLLLSLLLGGAAALTGASPASAHAALVSSDPAADSTVTESVERATLTFSEPPLTGLDAGLRIEVLDESGADVSSGSVEVSGASMSRAVDLGPGRYRVLWRYVSPDGHPITGEYGFTSAVEVETPDADPTSSPTAGDPAAGGAATSEPSSSAAAGSDDDLAEAGSAEDPTVLPWVAGGAALLALVVAVVALARRTRRPHARP